MWCNVRTNKAGKKRYRFVENYKNPLTQKWQNVSVTYGKNNREVRKEAQLKLNQKIEKKLQEITMSTTDITFHDLVQKYLEIAEKSLAVQTYERKVSQLTKLERDFIPKGSIAKNITPQFLSKMFDEMMYADSKHPLSNDTIESYKATISRVYELGIQYGYVTDNPAIKAKYTKRSEHKKKHDEIENKYLEDNEFKKILLDCDQQKRPDLKNLFVWMYLTGMRIGEATTIQVKNIKFDKSSNHYYAVVNGSLVVRRKPKKGQPRYSKGNSAKNKDSNRTVLLSPTAAALALKLCNNKSPEDYIFTNNWSTAKSGFFIASKVDKLLKSVAKRQGIKKKLVSHIFRHTHVSKLAEAGIPLPEIQRRVGHGNSRVTTQIYYHITNKMKTNLSETIEDFSKFLDN